MSGFVIGIDTMAAAWRVGRGAGMRRAAKYAERWLLSEAHEVMAGLAAGTLTDVRHFERLRRAAARCERIANGLPAFGGDS
jgi:hypothetical protein